MPNIIEAGRAAGRDRASEVVMWRDGSEVTQTTLNFQALQATRLQRQFVMSDALARAVAELAFDPGRSR